MRELELADIFAVIKETFYRWLGRIAGGSFNLLNVFLRGNLPPFGNVCLVVREGERYLLLVRENGHVSLPGGFMRWRERPEETAVRECAEETGLQIRVLDLIECVSCPAGSSLRMSTLTLVYSAEIAGGSMRRALEGRPGWFTEAEVRQSLDAHYLRFFDGYLRYYHQRTALDSAGETKTQEAEPSNS